MSPAPVYEAWERDPAHQAVDQWLAAWKSNHSDLARPPLSFADHLGREAVAMQNGGTSRVQLQQVFAAYGYDGVCMCGLKPGDVLPARGNEK